ncbi:hypothetical protein K523DRAFT_324688 [Schizophyllum commune Tattone D]|nr:hypothetical protein K523DRAFT_324688 [Schizophyllum commune Tattone D]
MRCWSSVQRLQADRGVVLLKTRRSIFEGLRKRPCGMTLREVIEATVTFAEAGEVGREVQFESGVYLERGGADSQLLLLKTASR